uniref:Uncharacterized protein n=1 Tax=Glossina pallidipes TaxID=7398 RepID=A0A1A9ZJ27_GLOPL
MSKLDIQIVNCFLTPMEMSEINEVNLIVACLLVNEIIAKDPKFENYVMRFKYRVSNTCLLQSYKVAISQITQIALHVYIDIRSTGALVKKYCLIDIVDVGAQRHHMDYGWFHPTVKNYLLYLSKSNQIARNICVIKKYFSQKNYTQIRDSARNNAYIPTYKGEFPHVVVFDDDNNEYGDDDDNVVDSDGGGDGDGDTDGGDANNDNDDVDNCNVVSDGSGIFN